MAGAVIAGDLQAWVALVAALGTAILGLVKYFDFRSRSERESAAGSAFATTVDALSADDEVKRLAGAILLRRFFSAETEQGQKYTPYAREALGVIAAVLRDAPPGTLQKLLADGLAYAPELANLDLQGCNLRNAYLGERPDRKPDFSRADFFEADLSGASLKNAVARDAVFFKATMRGTVLRGAELQGADFREADLEGARFEGANLTGARFDGARNVPEGLADAHR
jgi:Pentapeptide repeats (8 copies)